MDTIEATNTLANLKRYISDGVVDEKATQAINMAIRALEVTADPDTVSRQVVIDTVRKIILGFFSDKDGVMNDTEKTLLSVSKAICNGVMELPSTQPEPHWIPCSESLPDGKEYVLVTDYGETNIGRRFCGKWWLDYCGDKMKDVTAWMPLPEPYHNS